MPVKKMRKMQSICAIEGVSAAGIKEGKYGLALIRAEGVSAAAFTMNKACAAPIILMRERMKKGYLAATITLALCTGLCLSIFPLLDLANLIMVYMLGVMAVALSGCEASDVQLNGKVFDALGMNTSSVDRKAPDVKARAGIVVPPDLSSLPEPGSGKGQQAELPVNDYDASRTTSKADLERQQKEYCEKHYDMAKAMGDQDAALIEGPLGRCQKSVLNLIEGGSSSDEGQ